MNIKNYAIGTLLCSTVALSASANCIFPVFETSLSNAAHANVARDQAWVELSVAPIAVLELPAAVSRMGISPTGSLVFRSEDGQISGGVAYETSESVNVHDSGAQPASFFSGIFSGKHKEACLYSEGFRLSEQDYRIHLTLDAGEVFAFGKGDSHHFFILSRTQSDLVINGSMRGIQENLFRSFLSKIKIK